MEVNHALREEIPDAPVYIYSSDRLGIFGNSIGSTTAEACQSTTA
jgi:hypothetical protein